MVPVRRAVARSPVERTDSWKCQKPRPKMRFDGASLTLVTANSQVLTRAVTFCVAA